MPTRFKGIGSGGALLAHAIAKGRDAGLKWLWLGVWRGNEDAIAFYQRKGMEICGEHIFQFGDEPQTDYLMRLALA